MLKLKKKKIKRRSDMHSGSFNIMTRLVNKYLDAMSSLQIIDIGSGDVNGSYRKLFDNLRWVYKGLDIVAGSNVDVVAPTIPWPVADDSYDVVISGQCLEHVKAPWLWIKEIERICKPGGFVFIIAPSNFPIHRFPVDCWRILPDGMQHLLGEWCKFKVLEVGTEPFRDDRHSLDHVDYTAGDCFGAARKQ